MKNADDMITYATAPRLELTGNRQCVVDGLKSILEYSAERIKINLGKQSVTFIGDDLFINSFSHEGAIVEGMILRLEFGEND